MKSIARTTVARSAHRRIFFLGLVTSAIARIAGSSCAFAATEPAVSGLINPGAIVFSHELRRVYAVDRPGGRLVIYDDLLRTMRRVHVGAGPVSVAVNGKTATAYVTNADDGTVDVVDGLSGARVATLAVGGRPYSVAVDAKRGRAYVTDASGEGITVIDCATYGTRRLKTGSADLVAVNAARGTVDLIGYGTALRVLSGSSNELKEIPVGKHAWGIAVNNATGATYVCRIEDSEVVEIDADSGATATLQAGDIPCAVAVDSASNVLYVANYRGNSVTVLEGARRGVIATVPVGRHPEAVAIDPVRHLVFVANSADASITVIDAKTNGVLSTLPAGKTPYALAVVPGSNRLYVANNDSESPSTVVNLGAIGARLR
jgi:YVTN family beta-propeller protein